MLGDWPIVREEKEERGGEDKSGCLCFIWNCPPQATHGRPRLEAVWPVDSHTHTHIHSLTHTHTTHPSHIRSLNSFTIDRSRISTFAISFLVCRHLLSGRAEEGEAYSRPPLTAGRSRRVCLFYTLSHATAFAGIVSSHTVLTQHCL